MTAVICTRCGALYADYCHCGIRVIIRPIPDEFQRLIDHGLRHGLKAASIPLSTTDKESEPHGEGD